MMRYCHNKKIVLSARNFRIAIARAPIKGASSGHNKSFSDRKYLPIKQKAAAGIDACGSFCYNNFLIPVKMFVYEKVILLKISSLLYWYFADQRIGT